MQTLTIATDAGEISIKPDPREGIVQIESDRCVIDNWISEFPALEAAENTANGIRVRAQTVADILTHIVLMAGQETPTEEQNEN